MKNKNINKFIILIFAFTVMFSSVLFAEWEVSIGGDIMFISIDDKKNGSSFAICINTSIADDLLSVYKDILIAVVGFYSDKITTENSFVLKINKKSSNYIPYHIYDEDVVYAEGDPYIGVGLGSEKGVRSNNLIKILLDSASVELYNKDTGELLGIFNLNGLGRALKKNVGNTRWYKKLKDNSYY